MDERAIATGTTRGLALESGGRRYPILSLGAESCLIAAEEGPSSAASPTSSTASGW